MDKNNQIDMLKGCSNIKHIGVVQDKYLAELQLYEIQDMTVEEWNSTVTFTAESERNEIGEKEFKQALARIIMAPVRM